MTLRLTDAEMRALDELSVRKDLSKTAVLRQALRVYQMLDARVRRVTSSLRERSPQDKAELMFL